MPDPNRSHRTTSHYPSESHAAHIGLVLLEQAERALQGCNQPAPGDTPYRTAARLEVARTTIEQIDEILADHTSTEEPLLVTDRLRTDLQNTRATFEAAQLLLSPENLHHPTTEWYHSLETTVSENQTMLAIASAITTPTVTETEREARTIIAEQLWVKTREEHPAPRPTLITSGEQTIEMNNLTEEARRAHAQTATLSTDVVSRYDESLVLDISPRLKRNPKTAIEAARITASPSSMLFGILIDDEGAAQVDDAERELQEAYLQNREPQHVGPLDVLEKWVTPFLVFAHNGRKIAKHVTEPYPKGYPRKLAIAHMNVGMDMITIALDQSENTMPGANMAGAMMRDMARAAELSLHDIAAADINALLQKMESIGIPKGARVSALEALFNWDRNVALMFASDDNDSWRRQVNLQGAKRILHAAANEGMDPYGIQDLATALGYRTHELDLPYKRIPLHQLDKLAMEARLSGISEEAIARITGAL